MRTGGHPTNVSVDLMQMGMLEGNVRIVGLIGDDIFGYFIESYLKSKGVKTFLRKTKEYETSKCVALVIRGEDRRFIAEPSANEYLKVEDVEKRILENKPMIFYQASGVLGEYDFKIRHVLNIAKSINSITILDCVQPYGKDWTYIYPALSLTDIVHCNDVELRQMTKFENIEDGVKKLAEMGVKISVISLGAKGLYAYIKKERILIKQDAFKVDVIDPTGAGDALVAGIIYKLLTKGKNVEDLNLNDIIEILTYAQASGAACLTEIGTTPGVTRDRIEKIMKSQGDIVFNSVKITKLL
ncbi:MAG: carbohydrate kinase family protein [Nitrososphaeria archaeon]